VLAGPFTDWHVRTLDSTAVDALAGEWMEGALPETWFSASPARVRFQREPLWPGGFPPVGPTAPTTTVGGQAS
jgi:hypothetical protein